MSNGSAPRSGLLPDISQHLGTIFRHTLPGVLLVGGAALAYPKTLPGDLNSWQQLSILAIVTVTVGNALFALNRYGVHQAVEYLFYLAKIKGPTPSGRF